MLKNNEFYFHNNKIIIKNDNVYIKDNKLNLLGSGVDGKVYRYQDKAIKLYHDESVKDHLTNYQIDILSTFSTTHLILPLERLKNGNDNLGYNMKYINLENHQNILTINKKIIIDELQELEEELSLIGEKNFLLNDKLSNNLFYSDKLYLLDPDSLTYIPKANLSKRNLEVFTWYFIRDVIFQLNDEITKEEQRSLIRKLNFLYNKSNYSTLSSFLEKSMNFETLEEIRQNFIKKRVKVTDKY